MRKFAWLTVFAAAALFFSAPENAFAHPNHQHSKQIPVIQDTQQPQTIHAAIFETASPVADHVLHFDGFAVTAQTDPVQVCTHGGTEGYESCCGCMSHLSFALAVFDGFGVSAKPHETERATVPEFRIRQITNDLTRPPKSFV